MIWTILDYFHPMVKVSVIWKGDCRAGSKQSDQMLLICKGRVKKTGGKCDLFRTREGGIMGIIGPKEFNMGQK